MKNTTTPIIGHGKKQEKELPKADRALMYINNMAQNIQNDFKAANARITALENLCLFMMNINKDSYEEVQEFDMLGELNHYHPAIGLVYYRDRDNSFVKLIPYISNFTIEEKGEGKWVATSEKYKEVYELEGADEKEANEALDKAVYEFLDAHRKACDAAKKAEKEKEKDSESFRSDIQVKE